MSQSRRKNVTSTRSSNETPHAALTRALAIEHAARQGARPTNAVLTLLTTARRHKGGSVPAVASWLSANGTDDEKRIANSPAAMAQLASVVDTRLVLDSSSSGVFGPGLRGRAARTNGRRALTRLLQPTLALPIVDAATVVDEATGEKTWSIEWADGVTKPAHAKALHAFAVASIECLKQSRKAGHGTFALSMPHLAYRLGVTKPAAEATMRVLREQFGWVETFKQPRSTRTGKSYQATVWKLKSPTHAENWMTVPHEAAVIALARGSVIGLAERRIALEEARYANLHLGQLSEAERESLAADTDRDAALAATIQAAPHPFFTYSKPGTERGRMLWVVLWCHVAGLNPLEIGIAKSSLPSLRRDAQPLYQAVTESPETFDAMLDELAAVPDSSGVSALDRHREASRARDAAKRERRLEDRRKTAEARWQRETPDTDRRALSQRIFRAAGQPPTMTKAGTGKTASVTKESVDAAGAWLDTALTALDPSTPEARAGARFALTRLLIRVGSWTGAQARGVVLARTRCWDSLDARDADGAAA